VTANMSLKKGIKKLSGPTLIQDKRTLANIPK